MNRLILAAMATTALVGCYVDGPYVSSGYAYSGGVAVSSAPPPLQYEAQLDCGSSVWVPGSWAWGSGNWAWSAGSCMPYQTGYVYNQPYYSNGMYYRGYWGRPAPYFQPGHGGYYNGGYNRGYVTPPAAGYNRGYVQPAPAYNGGYNRGYVQPAPAYNGGGYNRGYVAPAPSYGGGGYNRGYVAPAPAYGGGGGGRYVQPAPAYRR